MVKKIILFLFLSPFLLWADEKTNPHELVISEDEPAIVVEACADKDIKEFIDIQLAEKINLLERMRSYIIGMRDQDHLLTLADAYLEKKLDATEATGILRAVLPFREGEIHLLRLNCGMRRGEDIIIGRYPSQLIARPLGNEAFHPGDPSLVPLTRWLDILIHKTWVSPMGAGQGVALSSLSGFSYESQLYALAASIAVHHYSNDYQRGFSGDLSANGYGLTTSTGFTSADTSGAVWLSVMSGWAGLGYTGKHNLEERQYGLSAVGASAWIAGWKNYAQVGASISAVTTNGNQVGIGGVISVSKDRVTSYKNKYTGEYDELINKFISEYQKKINYLTDEKTVSQKLLDLIKIIDAEGKKAKELQDRIEKITSELIELQGKVDAFQTEKEELVDKHFIEVHDQQSKGARVQGGFFANGISIGARAGLSKGEDRIYRFYTAIPRAKELLRDGSGDKLGLLRIPKKFDTQNFPKLETPHLWKTGEEVIETRQRTYYGSIVMGISGVPFVDIKAGISGSFVASFEIGVRKLPANKLEVTLTPTEIKEKGFFATSLNTVGPSFVKAASFAIVTRQTFIFDLDNSIARQKYSLLLKGTLPLSFSTSDFISKYRESENLLDVAILARKKLEESGILLTYLEKINVPAKKIYVGIGKIPAISDYRWAGLSYEVLNSKARVVSTNAQIAISRETSAQQITKSHGTSGTSNQSAYATIKRKFEKVKKISEEVSQDQKTNDDSEELDGYSWFFTGMTLRAMVNDSKVTGHEQNDMIELLNCRFKANIDFFPKSVKSHKQNREILVEREILPKDLDVFKAGFTADLIEDAARASGLTVGEIHDDLLSHMAGKQRNAIAEILIYFVDRHGFQGISAVHVLLNAHADLIVRTTSDTYSNPLQKAAQTEALITRDNPDPEGCSVDLDYETPSAKVRKIYKDVRAVVADIDRALLNLAYDPLFVDTKDLNQFESGTVLLREKKSVLRSKLIASKNRLLDLLDLEKQGMGSHLIIEIYKKLPEDELDLKQRIMLLSSHYPEPIRIIHTRVEIADRWKKIISLKKDAEEALESVSTDESTLVLGSVFVDNKKRELNYIISECEKLIDVRHLTPCDAQRLIDKLEKRGWSKTKVLYKNIAKHIGHVVFGNTQKDFDGT